MNNYSLPKFIYPAFSVNFDPINQKLYNQYGSTLDHNFVQHQLNSHEYIILDFNRDHPNFLLGPTTVLDAYNYFSTLGYNNVIYLTSEKITNCDQVKFFPSWLYCKSKEYSQVRINAKNKRKFKLSCLNRFPSPQRIYFFYNLLHKSYYKECLTSFLGLVNPYNNFKEVGERNPIYNNIPEKTKQFYEQTKFSKSWDADILNWRNDHNPNHDAYTDSYMNIITESTHYHSFFTEKTAKALATEQLFMMVGGTNSIANLQALGIECFDILNLDYDQITDMIERTDYVIDIIDNYYYNIEDMFWQFESQRIYNTQYFLSNDFRKKCLESVGELIK